MFINLQRKNKSFVYHIIDNKNLLLHYLDKEIETLNFQSPVFVFIEINPNDRIGYRKKLYKIFRKLNKLTNYYCSIGSVDQLNASFKELERKM